MAQFSDRHLRRSQIIDKTVTDMDFLAGTPTVVLRQWGYWLP